ncbi:hypothetical protein MCOR25_006303 [Pyricularia grisea]|uniref:Glucose-methanol-choline oxidoreductase N-terminal domain-containing protein n=1 Tax=Pyricularia grisea TaxID=148305 RepID=A0A6P8BGS1_PYRGI|nr:uncharacterized protein PgNI_02001 [Pyricularia grisea]KAI6362068.1 hypothetical protein MCOR25_006303 [Pyricularia grisea]TLD15852.1 hypothetical protein PgNI_02001 [Pyricularia grisea]
MKSSLLSLLALTGTGAYAQGRASGNNTATPSGPSTNLTGFDYIVAGGGAAGIVVAQRLVESGKSVILLERGGPSTHSTGGNNSVPWNNTITPFDVPALYSAVPGSSYCTDTAGSAGCVLGGGTVINAMMFVHPQSADFNDKFPSGWKWEDVKDAATRLYERIPGTTTPSADGKLYDQGGYDVLSKFFTTAGFKSVDTMANPDDKKDVFTHPPWMINKGIRSGPIQGYLPLTSGKKNFKLQTNCKVLRAVRNDSTVTGVEVEMADGKRQIVSLSDPKTGKVILAAGTMSTPKILFASGIGQPEPILTAAKVNGVQLPQNSSLINSPVGQGVMDHPVFSLDLKVKNSSSSTKLESINATTLLKSPAQEDVDLFARGSGLLAQSTQRLNFWSEIGGDAAGDGQRRFFQGTCSVGGSDTLKIKVYMTHGLTSTGELAVNATSGATIWAKKPWMNSDGDKKAAAAFLDRIIAMAKAPGSNLELAKPNITGTELAQSFVSGSHYVGSARMGEDNKTAVVDTNTKVYGTDNLFVVDASIHPDVPTGNTQVAVMIVAEQAAEKIMKLSGPTEAKAWKRGGFRR